MPELRGREASEGGLVFEGRRHPRVVREALEGDEFGVGQHAEQVGDGVAVGRIGQQVDLWNFFVAHAPKSSAAASVPKAWQAPAR